MTEQVTVNRGLMSGLFKTFNRLSGWKRMLLMLAALAAGLGGFGAVAGKLQDRPQDYVDATRIIESLTAKSSLTADDKDSLRDAEKRQAQHTGFWFDSLAPHTWRAAISFIGAFIVGYAFRRFVATMAVITGIAFAGIAALTYFDIVDLSNVRAGVEKSAGVVTKLATQFKDTVLAWLPSSVTGIGGFLIGFMRR
jgi:uncharacterized membrane protein (Fun14 family)